jgi:hypothetical protein
MTGRDHHLIIHVLNYQLRDMFPIQKLLRIFEKPAGH